MLCGGWIKLSAQENLTRDPGRGHPRIICMHQPIAGSDEDCVCLTVTDALLQFKTPTARLLQPFVGIWHRTSMGITLSKYLVA
jgi:hypothetical protein